jgi:flagellar basal body rod protein FlgB
MNKLIGGFFIVLLASSLCFSQTSDKFLFFDSSTTQLEQEIYKTTKKHALYSFNIANITTPGFEPILYPEDQAKLDKMVPSDSEYFKKALLEHLSASMAFNKNVQASYLSIYKKKFDTYRQIATMGKR